MKFFFFVILFSFSGVYAQQTETTKTPQSTESKIIPAEFPGGKTAFRNEFMRMVHSYFDISAYAVNGKFTFVIEIDEKEKMSNLKVFPKVKNYEEFVQDMAFAMGRVKKKWKPATKNGVPTSSSFAFEINFTSDHSDVE